RANDAVFFLQSRDLSGARLFGSEGKAVEVEVRQRHDVGRKAPQVLRKRSKAGGALEGLLVHVEAAIDLDLQRMEPLGGAAVVLGYEPARIRLVVRHAIAHGAEYADRSFRQGRRAGDAEAITDDEVGPHAVVAEPDARRHGMTVDQ